MVEEGAHCCCLSLKAQEHLDIEENTDVFGCPLTSSEKRTGTILSLKRQVLEVFSVISEIRNHYWIPVLSAPVSVFQGSSASQFLYTFLSFYL